MSRDCRVAVLVESHYVGTGRSSCATKGVQTSLRCESAGLWQKNRPGLAVANPGLIIAAWLVLVDWACCWLIFREATGGWPDGLLEFAERDIERFFRCADEVDLHALEHFGLQVLLHIRLVL